ncbi:nucleoside-diphosphate kinase [Actinoplanes sp. NPDC023801]|uniref:nucleoside-diphosphate kinase n=1 Tax=Actinoplanes sp. NPDC023801 TaxID=3154595 RepID=UPI0033F395BC
MRSVPPVTTPTPAPASVVACGATTRRRSPRSFRPEDGISEHAFLLLKPDCLRRGLTGEAERLARDAGLRIDGRQPVTLSPADVRHLWSEYDEAGHSLTLAFLDRYLTTGPSEVLLLSGPDAFEAARRLKREIRARHADGPFANVVHAAERRAELDRQRDHLLGRSGDGTDPPPSSPRPPGIDFRPLFDVTALADEVWPLVQGPPPDPGPFRLDSGDLGRAVLLGPDRNHTLDSTVTALWHALPGVEPRRAVLLTLHAGWSGATPIAVGGQNALRDCLGALREHGILNCGIGRPQPFRVPER